MLKSLFSRHVAQLQLSVEFRMQMSSSAVSVCLFLGQEINEHYVPRGLSPSTENFSKTFWLDVYYTEYWKLLRATIYSDMYLYTLSNCWRKVYNVHKANQVSLKIRVTFHLAIALQLYSFVFLSHVISIVFAKKMKFAVCPTMIRFMLFQKSVWE